MNSTLLNQEVLETLAVHVRLLEYRIECVCERLTSLPALLKYLNDSLKIGVCPGFVHKHRCRLNHLRVAR